MRWLTLISLCLAACGDFEDPSVVLDLRVLGMRADPPEVVSPFNRDDPGDPSGFALVPVEVCALVADPAQERRLSYSLVACAPRDEGRCDDVNAPFLELSLGTAADPETGDAADTRICGTVPDGGLTLAILERAVQTDQLSGFGGVEVQIELVVRGQDEPFEASQFASKRILYAPAIPAERVANSNPSVERFAVSVNEGPVVDLPLGRCGEIEPFEVGRDDELEIEPIEPAGTREDYVLPTFDGDFLRITESTRYAWYATHGDWSRGSTGGTRDLGGNTPALDTTWTAQLDDDVAATGAVDARLWFIQRDERGGQAWYESCVRISP